MLPKLLLAGALPEPASCVMPSAASASASSSSVCKHPWMSMLSHMLLFRRICAIHLCWSKTRQERGLATTLPRHPSSPAFCLTYEVDCIRGEALANALRPRGLVPACIMHRSSKALRERNLYNSSQRHTVPFRNCTVRKEGDHSWNMRCMSGSHRFYLPSCQSTIDVCCSARPHDDALTCLVECFLSSART